MTDTVLTDAEGEAMFAPFGLKGECFLKYIYIDGMAMRHPSGQHFAMFLAIITRR
jgi:hypothetical protein